MRFLGRVFTGLKLKVILGFAFETKEYHSQSLLLTRLSFSTVPAPPRLNVDHDVVMTPCPLRVALSKSYLRLAVVIH